MPTTNGDPRVKIFSVLLAPLSWLYGIGVRARNWFFDIGVRAVADAGIPVISVGNLTAGGTGKTPFVAMIAARLMEEGKKVAIVSRGYGRRTGGPVIVSGADGVLAGADDGGDEPVELARKLPGAIVAVDEKRVRISRMIVERWSPDVIVMDDGFQHRMMKRNFDCVLIDASKDLTAERLLPSGMMREPLGSLRRADMIVLTQWHDGCDTARIRSVIRRYSDGPIAICRPVLSGVRDGKTGAIVPYGDLRGARCTVFCGVGSPDSFRRTLGDLGVTFPEVLTFADHHRYTVGDMEMIVGYARSEGSKLILTTEKDNARLSPQVAALLPDDIRILTIGIAIEMIEGEDELWSGIRKAIGR